MVNIFSVGTPTVDNIIPVSNNPNIVEAANAILTQAGVQLTPGCKVRINAATANLLFDLMSNCDGVVTAPGGSAANTLRAMHQLLGDYFSAKLYTMLGTGAKSQMLRESLTNSNISLTPGLAGVDLEIQQNLAPSESFVFVFPDGQRGIVNYPGTIKDHIKDVKIQPAAINTSDVVMLYGATREVYGTEIFDNILKIRWDANKPLWFSLPTNHEFMKNNREYFEYLLPSINVLVGNSEELGAFLGEIKDKVSRTQQSALNDRLKTGVRVLGERGWEKGPISFITEGELGAQVISNAGMLNLRRSEANCCVNTLGAGDVTTGVFYSGIQVGMGPAAAATLAMTAGAITVEHLAAVPENLAEQLARRDPVNWGVFAEAREKSNTRIASAAR